MRSSTPTIDTRATGAETIIREASRKGYDLRILMRVREDGSHQFLVEDIVPRPVPDLATATRTFYDICARMRDVYAYEPETSAYWRTEAREALQSLARLRGVE